MVDGTTRIAMKAVPPAQRIVLRGRDDDGVFAQAAGKLFQAALPSDYRRGVRVPSGWLFRLAPDEWLAQLEVGSQRWARLETSLAGLCAAAVEVSAAWSGFGLDGTDAHIALTSGSAVDFSPAGFPVGAFAQCRLGPFMVRICRVAGPFGLQVLAARSQRRTLLKWLQAAGCELNGSEVDGANRAPEKNQEMP